MDDHFVWEGIVWQTVYNDLNGCNNGQSIVVKLKLYDYSLKLTLVWDKVVEWETSKIWEICFITMTLFKIPQFEKSISNIKIK